MKRTSITLLALAVVTLAGATARAAIISTVGVYDEQITQQNTVDKSATVDTNANEIGYSTFKSEVEAAWLAGRGAVIDFETGGPGGTSLFGLIEAQYASASKTLNIRDPNEHYTGPGIFPGRTAISGDKMLARMGPHPTFVFDFDSITGGDWMEKVVATGATLLSRGDCDRLPQDFIATAYFSGGGSHSVTANIARSNAGDDTFFGFRAPDGQWLTSLHVGPTSGQVFTGLDDLGFITAIIPEPGSLLLLACGALALLARRRRR